MEIREKILSGIDKPDTSLIMVLSTKLTCMPSEYDYWFEVEDW